MSLYPFAQQWPGTIWLYSDPHFGDEEMKYLRKNYIGDEEQVRRINSKAGKNDTLVILGDIGDISWVKKLRAKYKVLICGNHDRGASYYQRVYEEDNHLFDEVYTGFLTISDKIVLSHEAIDLPYIFNIHGHEHGKEHIHDKNKMNLCAEFIDYTPITLNSIIKGGRLAHIDSIHRQTIDNATERKIKRSK